MRIGNDQRLFYGPLSFLFHFYEFIDRAKVLGVEDSVSTIFHDQQSLIVQKSTLTLFIDVDVVDSVT